ncbi:hypothetical protein [Nocardia harenae]|uniref:hypothetical protein n=1 Tax=Nocardia harenae TaxID=358707 RepID=UPI000A6D35B5|nr:hypothetical protein [Nocardia harenae]
MSKLTLLHRPLFAGGLPPNRSRAAARISAYVYGNVLILAALIPIPVSPRHVGILIVAGVALSTFVAHAFAESIGQSIREDRSLTAVDRRGELRDSLPILTAAVLPCAVLAWAWFGGLEPRTAQLLAEGTVLVRIGGTAFVIRRLRGRRPHRSTLIQAVLVTAVATAVVVVKVILTH